MIIVFATLFLLKDMHLELNTVYDECFSLVFGSGQEFVTIANIQTKLIGDLIQVKNR